MVLGLDDDNDFGELPGGPIRSSFSLESTTKVTITVDDDDRIISRRDGVVLRTLGFRGPDERKTGYPRLVSGYGVSNRTRDALVEHFARREAPKLKPGLRDTLYGDFLHPHSALSRKGSAHKKIHGIYHKATGKGCTKDASPSNSPKPEAVPLSSSSSSRPTTPHSATDGPAVPLLYVDGETVLQPWFGELARLFLVEVQVHIQVAVRRSEPLFPHNKGRCNVSALTALFLAMRVREEAAACSFVFDLGEELIAAEIRKNGLGGFVGACTTRLVVSDTMYRIAARKMYSIALGGLQAARDMLVAYMMREEAGDIGPSSVHAKSAAMFDMILDTPDSINRRDNLDIADIDLLATRMGLVYGALVASVVKAIEERRAQGSMLLNVARGLTKLGTAAATTGASIIPYGLAAAAVNDFSSEIGTVVVDGVAGKLKQHEEELKDALEIVCDKFNTEVLHAAEIGFITGLNIYSEPVGRESRIVASPVDAMAQSFQANLEFTPTGERIVRRPTAGDVARFKATATNVFILMTRQEGVKLVNNIVSINEPLQIMPGVGSYIIPSPTSAPMLAAPRIPYVQTWPYGPTGGPARAAYPAGAGAGWAPPPVRVSLSLAHAHRNADAHPAHDVAPSAAAVGDNAGASATAPDDNIGVPPPVHSNTAPVGPIYSGPAQDQQEPQNTYLPPQHAASMPPLPQFYPQQMPRYHPATSSILAASTRVTGMSMR
ncbi:hypothetical protein CspHIS471_0101610 [Cutaneotrichosporon sp. HIS471]|nr:hypothetical protein CspHIS471_0101610 [Cutaneotrichosporon sp. HIS471]